MEYILLTTMFLFIGFCTFILALAISQTFGKGKEKKPVVVAAASQTHKPNSVGRV